MTNTLLTELKNTVNRFSNLTALYSKDKDNNYQTVSFKQLYTEISELGAGLLSIGIKREDHVGILSDNRKEWLIGSFAVLGIGAIDVPRGSDSTADEMKYILGHSECRTTFVENDAQLMKIMSSKQQLPQLKTIIVMDEEFSKPASKEKGLEIFTFREIRDKGKALLEKKPEAFEEEVAKGQESDLATIIYTSGTTGEPKGVMLTHGNFLHQARAPKQYIRVTEKDIALSILPIWHSFERSVEYIILFSGAAIAYSKPVAKAMLKDIDVIRPTLFPSVPRIWEAIRSGVYKKVKEEGAFKMIMFNFFISVGSSYAYLSNMIRGLLPQFKKRYRILDILVAIIPFLLLSPIKLLGNVLVFNQLKKKLGGRCRWGISGAGALPVHVDNFFAAAGILLLEGYGLTEAAPICTVRKEKAPVTNTIGPLIPEMEMKILDSDGRELGPGKKGVLYVKGPNIMRGYYKREQDTANVLSKDGWLNTGDLVMKTYKGELKILGREKETIVLIGGENIEPEPIEKEILQSELIDHVMVVGQDQRYLCALIVPNPENLENFVKSKGIPYSSQEELIDLSAVQEHIKDIINGYINTKKGFKIFERIFKFKLINQTFEPGRELTNSLKMKRNVIAEMYKKEIAELYAGSN